MAWWDLSLVVDNKVGPLAAIGDAFGAAGLNIEGLWTHNRDGDAHVHLLLQDREAGEKLAASNGWRLHKVHEVLVAPLENRPGWLGQQTRRLADAGLNVEWCYIATGDRIVLSVKDLAKAREVWGAVGATR